MHWTGRDEASGGSVGRIYIPHTKVFIGADRLGTNE